MTEKEKAKLGELYDANYDLDLIEERRKAKQLCYEFNILSPLKEEKGREILKKLFGEIKNNFTITAPFYLKFPRRLPPL